MSNPFSRRKSLPPAQSPTHHTSNSVDDLFDRLKQHDPEWLAATLQERWLRVSPSVDDAANSNGGHSDSSPPPKRPLLERFKRGSQHAGDASAKPVSPWDITQLRLPRDRAVSQHVQLVRDFDWSATDLGPMSCWSPELKRMVNVCLIDPRPAALWWTKQRILIYNEGYSFVLGARHPQVLGLPFVDAWPELQGDFDTHFRAGEEEGRATSGDTAFYMVERNGFQEELWASWSIIPVPADNGGIGLYNVVFETTKQVLAERRMSTLLWLGQCTSAAKDTQDFWKQTVTGLEPNKYDVPFAAFYAAASPEHTMQHLAQPNQLSEQWEAASQGHVTPSPSDRSSSISTTRHWTLEGMIGLPATCPGLPSRIDSDTAAESITSVFRSTIATGRTTVLTVKDGTFPKGLQGVARSRAFGDDCTAAVLCPIGPTGRENVLGFMLIGINPRHSYDTEYKQFVQLLVRQMDTSIASVVLIEEELKRSRAAAELAAQDRIRLSEQLAVTQQAAKDSETRFRTMADLAPVAMFHFDEMGNILYANKTWFDLTQHPTDGFYPLSWYSVIHEDDKGLMDQEWAKLGRGEPVHFELRLKRPFVTPETLNGEPVVGDTWIIASAYADKRDDGTVKGILGCLTDISRQKWSEGLQARRTDEAMELKRQQENFMDMTSHEARNPLSAITLCAESILTTFQELLDLNQEPITLSKDIVASHLESAEIIVSCAQHQKRIIDDVLTLSKLDSGMLVITPVEVQPADTIKKALKMFDSELQKASIELQYIVAPSYQALNVDWVRLDPSRLLQILINLLTNAIKFTQTQQIKNITVTLEASVDRPSNFDHDVQYLINPISKEPISPRAGDDVYLSIAVRDTGRGITPDEMNRLFHRFQQASPKTHIKYGGSGLGLFISRELARLQGGQIGVASEAGIGSTFAFFVRAHRCSPPQPKYLTRHDSNATTASSGRKRSRAEILNSASVEAHAHVAAEVASIKMEGVVEAEVAIAQQHLHLLVVEDNLVNQKVMSKQLQNAGYSVSVANHGHEALDHILSTHFHPPSTSPLDVVLMDVEMPIMDGLACARRIREMELRGELRSHVPVVAVTANARAEQQAAALNAGMDSVVTKPFRMLELLPELEKVRKASVAAAAAAAGNGR